jgi:hypothetical protein
LIDATSLELLERLLALTDRVPLLILALFLIATAGTCLAFS